MPVSYIFSVVGHSEEEMRKRIEVLSRKSPIAWLITLIYYKSEKTKEDVVVIKEKEQCCIYSGGDTVEGSISLISILQRGDELKEKQKIEIVGKQYEINDFLVKIGTVLMNAEGKGVMVEIEYKPCTVPGQCLDLIIEFISYNLGPFDAAQKLPKNFEFENLTGIPANYGNIHKAIQYIAFMVSSDVLRFQKITQAP